jgi:hypothetical protein
MERPHRNPVRDVARVTLWATAFVLAILLAASAIGYVINLFLALSGFEI